MTVKHFTSKIKEIVHIWLEESKKGVQLNELLNQFTKDVLENNTLTESEEEIKCCKKCDFKETKIYLSYCQKCGAIVPF